MRNREQLSALIKKFRAERDQKATDHEVNRVPKMLHGLVGGDLRRVTQGSHNAIDGEGIVDAYRDPSSVADFLEVVKSRGLASLEIGSQRGYFAVGRAQQFPDEPFLACEVRRVDCRKLIRRRDRENIKNLYLMIGDVRLQLLPLLRAGPVFQEVFILFPDPWWKRRHQKRRLFKDGFLDFLAHVVLPGGVVLLKTDVEGYRDEVLALVAECANFEHTPALAELERLSNLPPSRRERELLHAGLPIYTMYLKRNDQEARTELFEHRGT